MAISNLSTGLRPGVCTSTTRPSTPFEGQMIYETDTNRVLVYEGAAWVMIADTDTPPGLQLIKAQTIGSAVTSVTVTDVFSSEFENYLITVSGGVCGADYGLNMYLGSTRSGYYYTGTYHTYGNTSAWIGASNAAEWGAVGIATTNTLQANISVSGPNLAKNTYFSNTYIYGHPAGGRAAMGGYLADNTQYTSFTLFINALTITGGTIRVYGYRNTI